MPDVMLLQTAGLADSRAIHPIPASIIRLRMREIILGQGADPEDAYNKYAIEMYWGYILHEFGVPIAFSWSEIPDPDRRHRQRIPHGLTMQLIDQTIQSGLSVVYRGQRYLVVDTFCELGQLGETITEEPMPLEIFLADPRYIDLEA